MNDVNISELIVDQVTMEVKMAILELFGSIKTTLIVMFNEFCATITDVATTAATAVGPPSGGLMSYRDFNNTKPQ